jgi:hypothetical protein
MHTLRHHIRRNPLHFSCPLHSGTVRVRFLSDRSDPVPCPLPPGAEYSPFTRARCSIFFPAPPGPAGDQSKLSSYL